VRDPAHFPQVQRHMSESSNPFVGSAAQVEQIVQSFEQAWEQGESPSIDDYLYATGTDVRSLLIELVHVDLECRLKGGEAARVENYLKRYPDLAQDVDVVLQLIEAEFTLRRRQEPGLSLQEFSDRFPEHGEHLSKLETGEAGSPTTVPPDACSDGADPHRTQDYVPSKKADAHGHGAHVPGYEILGTLGRGGMGVVYKARQIKLNRTVALKMILGGAHAGHDMLERFRREAEAVARMQHPNIVQIYEVGEAEGRPFFSLEFVDGGSLDKQIASTPLTAQKAAALVETLARAMQVAHERGIVHRDLKPANVLLTADGTPKITDFGLAKQLEEESGQTRSGAVMGTPSFMAPEQASGANDTVGPLADVYALGAVLYDLLTGRPPFKGATVLDTLDQVRNQEPVPPSRLQPKVPRDLETICLKCLHKDAARRYATASELAEDLRRFLAGEPIKARPVGLWTRGIKYARRKPFVVMTWGATAAALLFLVLGTGYVLVRRNQDLAADLKHYQVVDQNRVDATPRLAAGDQAALRRDMPAVEAAAKEVLARVGTEPALEDLRVRAASLEAVPPFIDHCNSVLRHQVVEIEGNREESLQATRIGAAAVVAFFGLGDDGPRAADAPAAHLSDAVRAKLKEDCYQVLLAWSDAELQSGKTADRKAHATEALRILDRAKALGMVTRSYHTRRAALLKVLDDAKGAEHEQKLADSIRPTLAVDFFILGLEAGARGDREAQTELLRDALDRDPDQLWANYLLAANHIQANNPALAVGLLDRCVRLQPKFVWPYILRGFAHGHDLLHNYDLAFADFARAEAANPDSLARYAILINRGVIRERYVVRAHQGKLQDAFADFTRAAELLPDQSAAYTNLAEVSILLDAQEQLSKSLVHVGPYQTYASLAEVHLPRPWSDRALEQFGKAIALQQRAALYRSRARLYLMRGDYAAALADLNEAIRREPRASRDLVDDHLERGKILYRQGKYADALQSFDVALTIKPTYQLVEQARKAEAAIHQLRAEALLELNRFDEALRSLNEVHGAAATSTTYRARGLAHAKLADYTRAIEDYTKALELERAEGKLSDPLTLAYRGWAYLINDAPKLALRDFDEALKQRDCDRVDCHNGRGYSRVLLGQWKEAVADAEAALNDKPTLARHWYNAARIYAQAAAKVDPDPLKSDARTQDQRRQFEDRALRLLRLACEKSPPEQRAAFWKEYVQADPALRAVKRNPVYVQLAAEYGRGYR
jgi:tetratricopeptide (TPR) repeat protein/tRNA A-37 threonylcarbamoyl transferase component Bud32